MSHITGLELLAVDLPFRKPFKHAAAERRSSSSLFLKCVTDSGAVGYGEALPREYVTGETRDGAFQLLLGQVLPRLFELQFSEMQDVTQFLSNCDGKAPADWVEDQQPQTAAWCAVDLALLDAFGRAFQTPVTVNHESTVPDGARYSAVISSEVSLKTLLLIRLSGISQVKLKLEETANENAARRCRRILGPSCDIRADANMTWTVDQAVSEMQKLAGYGIRSFEQPLAADDIDGLAELVTRTPALDVMVDESVSHRASLETLIARRACTAVNVRISKCGGLIAALQRCRETIHAGLKLQIGCQVGESSLLSAAQLKLLCAVPEVLYLEGCFGKHLLEEDPTETLLQFGRGGRSPTLPTGPGLGVSINEDVLARWTTQREVLTR